MRVEAVEEIDSHPSATQLTPAWTRRLCDSPLRCLHPSILFHYRAHRRLTRCDIPRPVTALGTPTARVLVVEVVEAMEMAQIRVELMVLEAVRLERLLRHEHHGVGPV